MSTSKSLAQNEYHFRQRRNEMTEQAIEGTGREIEQVQLGTIQADSPQDIVIRATAMAKTLANIINEQKLFSIISGRKYVRVEGWTTLGAMLGIMPREVSVTELENGDYEATVELIRGSDGAVIGRASSIVSMDETTWSKRPRYARRSMAVTRATGKAYRLGFSWIMKLAGYEPTPAEEMPMEGSYRELAKPKRKPAPKQEQINEATEDAGPEHPPFTEPMTIERAAKITDSKGTPYIEIDSDTLSKKTIGISKVLNKPDLTDEKREFYQEKLDAIRVILQARNDGSLAS
jgi:hypothetical protein